MKSNTVKQDNMQATEKLIQIERSEFRNNLRERINKMNEQLPEDERVSLSDESFLDDIINNFATTSELMSAFNYRLVLVSRMP